MNRFHQTAVDWWATRTRRHPTATATERDEAHQALLDAMPTADVEDPVRQAVVAYISMESRHMMDGAGPSGWRERDAARTRLVDALNAAKHGRF